MRLKQKPVKPKKIKVINERFYFDYMDKTLKDFTDWADFHKVDYKDVIISIEQDYDSAQGIASFKREETDAEYNERLAKYKQRLEEYNHWYRDNKEEVENILKARHDKAEKIRNEQIQKLEKELKKLQKAG